MWIYHRYVKDGAVPGLVDSAMLDKTNNWVLNKFILRELILNVYGNEIRFL